MGSDTMNYEQSDLDLMKRDVDEFGVEALLTPEALKLLIADLEEARGLVELARSLSTTAAVLSARMDKLDAELPELPELRRDRDRLDWLEQQPSKYEWAVTLAHGCVFVTRNKTTGHPSLRDALDAAMGSAK